MIPDAGVSETLGALLIEIYVAVLCVPPCAGLSPRTWSDAHDLRNGLCSLYGIVTMQVLLYQTQYFDDDKYKRGVVLVVWYVGCLHDV